MVCRNHVISTEHGEVFVLDDGDETDQDMGNYERFMEITLSRANYMTTGRVYDSVIHRERNLEYEGKCVQVVPHIALEVIDRINQASQKADSDITIIEIGKNSGEYENILFFGSHSFLKILRSPQDVLTVTGQAYLPILEEMKTEPTLVWQVSNP